MSIRDIKSTRRTFSYAVVHRQLQRKCAVWLGCSLLLSLILFPWSLGLSFGAFLFIFVVVLSYEQSHAYTYVEADKYHNLLRMSSINGRKTVMYTLDDIHEMKLAVDHSKRGNNVEITIYTGKFMAQKEALSFWWHRGTRMTSAQAIRFVARFNLWLQAPWEGTDEAEYIETQLVCSRIPTPPPLPPLPDKSYPIEQTEGFMLPMRSSGVMVRALIKPPSPEKKKKKLDPWGRGGEEEEEEEEVSFPSPAEKSSSSSSTYNKSGKVTSLNVHDLSQHSETAVSSLSSRILAGSLEWEKKSTEEGITPMKAIEMTLSSNQSKRMSIFDALIKAQAEQKAVNQWKNFHAKKKREKMGKEDMLQSIKVEGNRNIDLASPSHEFVANNDVEKGEPAASLAEGFTSPWQKFAVKDEKSPWPQDHLEGIYAETMPNKLKPVILSKSDSIRPSSLFRKPVIVPEKTDQVVVSMLKPNGEIRGLFDDIN